MISIDYPAQSFPPLDGAGLLHIRLLDLIPDPHDTVQAENGPHCPHIPLTVTKDIILILREIDIWIPIC